MLIIALMPKRLSYPVRNEHNANSLTNFAWMS